MFTRKEMTALIAVLVIVILALWGIAGCGSSSDTESISRMGAMSYPDLSRITLEGAGASFPFPIYSMWADEYNSLTGLRINYQSIGSGGGIAQIKAGTVLFGASDNPLGIDELNEAGLIQFPMIMGGVVPVANLSGVAPGQLKITSDVLAQIYLGKITRWNDPAIAALNSGMTLPNKDITVVHRSDGSGTTWIFSTYLTAVSRAWAEGPGAGKSLDWPAGVGGQGNAGVANYVAQIDGSIGYVEYAYAKQNNLTHVALQNRAGNFVEPTAENFQAAAANADWANAPGYYVVLVDQPGDNSWPITGASFILIYKEQMNLEKAEAMLNFFDWAYRHGGDFADQLDYVAIPENVYEMVEETWRRELRYNGQAVWQ